MGLVGAIIGDIIGSRFEFPSWRPSDLDYKNVPLFDDTDEMCSFTDDTVMSVATKYAIRNDISFTKSYRMFGHQYAYVGYGNLFEEWLSDSKKKAYGSYGNGSAMRVSYIGEIAKDELSAECIATESASCTHNSQAGIKGAVVTATTIMMCKQGGTKIDVHKFAHKAYKDNYYTCDETLDEIRQKYKWSSLCDDTVPVAIRCFLESTDYESCIRNCLSLPCDMDTMCCIAGGIAESYYETTGLDDEEILKKYLPQFLYNIVYK